MDDELIGEPSEAGADDEGMSAMAPGDEHDVMMSDMGAEAEALACDAEREQHRDVLVECVVCVGDDMGGGGSEARRGHEGEGGVEGCEGADGVEQREGDECGARGRGRRWGRGHGGRREHLDAARGGGQRLNRRHQEEEEQAQQAEEVRSGVVNGSGIGWRGAD